jgi:single-strand DNA-binding protein
MSSRSLNKVELIGNLTRDPELRYTPTGAAVCTIGLATNRYWTTESGEKKEETEFHRVVAWNKLAELCSQLLVKGRKIYVEGRLRTNTWQTADGMPRSTTEIVIEDMIILDSRRPGVMPAEEGTPAGEVSGGQTTQAAGPASPSQGGPSATTYAQPMVKKSSSAKASADAKAMADKSGDKAEEKTESAVTENVNPDDIPF